MMEHYFYRCVTDDFVTKHKLAEYEIVRIQIKYSCLLRFKKITYDIIFYSWMRIIPILQHSS